MSSTPTHRSSSLCARRRTSVDCSICAADVSLQPSSSANHQAAFSRQRFHDRFASPARLPRVLIAVCLSSAVAALLHSDASAMSSPRHRFVPPVLPASFGDFAPKRRPPPQISPLRLSVFHLASLNAPVIVSVSLKALRRCKISPLLRYRHARIFT